jgi:hypothetical protein
MAMKCCTAVRCCHSGRKLHHQAQTQQQASPCLCPTPWHLAAKSNVSCTCRGRAALHILHGSPSAGAASRRALDKLPYATDVSLFRIHGPALASPTVSSAMCWSVCSTYEAVRCGKNSSSVWPLYVTSPVTCSSQHGSCLSPCSSQQSGRWGLGRIH